MTAVSQDLTLAPAQASSNDRASQDLQARLAGLGGLNGKKLPPEAKEKKLREACEGFESIFIQKMWQEMRKTVPQNGIMHGREEHFWQDMYDQELAKKMTSAGGIGLANMMYEQLSRNLLSASRTTINATPAPARAFVPEAVPLLPEAKTEGSTDAVRGTKVVTPASPAAQSGQKNGGMPSIYDGVAPTQATADDAPAAEKKPAADKPETQAAKAPNPDLIPGAMNVPINNPEVERALAALRAEQARRNGNAGSQAMMADMPAGQGRRRALSDQERTDIARREAGDQLGSRGVRAPLKPQTEHAQQRTERALQARENARGSAQPLAVRQMAQRPVGEEPPAATAQTRPQVDPLPGSVTPQQAAGTTAQQAQTRPRRVRYTTNIPQNSREHRGQDLIRTLNTDGTGYNSRAGAGIAAYHDARKSVTAMPGMSARQAGPAQPAAPQAAHAGTTDNAAPAAIPPLTARDLRS